MGIYILTLYEFVLFLKIILFFFLSFLPWSFITMAITKTTTTATARHCHHHRRPLVLVDCCFLPIAVNAIFRSPLTVAPTTDTTVIVTITTLTHHCTANGPPPSLSICHHHLDATLDSPNTVAITNAIANAASIIVTAITAIAPLPATTPLPSSHYYKVG